jgi:hypothetical protein
VIVVSRQPLASSEGGDQLLSLLDGRPGVIAALAATFIATRSSPAATTG